MSSEKRTTDVTEDTPNVESPLKKKVKTDDEPTPAEGANGDAAEPMVVENVEKETNGTTTEPAEETKTVDASNWTPPPFGAVCWLQIPASDVVRAKAFYTAAFDFKFQPNPEDYKEEDVAMFVLGGDQNLTGGITKAVPNSTPGGGTILYFMVNDVDEQLKKIEGLGGKTREEKKPEGKTGLMALFEDTEGNVHGVYQLKPKDEEKAE